MQRFVHYFCLFGEFCLFRCFCLGGWSFLVVLVLVFGLFCSSFILDHREMTVSFFVLQMWKGESGVWVNCVDCRW